MLNIDIRHHYGEKQPGDWHRDLASKSHGLGMIYGTGGSSPSNALIQISSEK